MAEKFQHSVTSRQWHGYCSPNLMNFAYSENSNEKVDQRDVKIGQFGEEKCVNKVKVAGIMLAQAKQNNC